MRLFKSKKSVKITKNRVLINFIIENSNEILQENQGDKGHILELLLCCSNPIINDYRIEKPDNFEDFQYEFYGEIHKYITENNLETKIYCPTLEFINNRALLYFHEINIAFDGTLTLPTKLAYNLLEKPLQKNPDDYIDLVRIIDLTKNLGTLLDKIRNNMNLVY